ncbi:hypothetical protein [Oligoflexus tunisiensis]|uniref:hypothetical protein n=1 Tax=Oligoflexus tunisiensis TaxID=708132 RepID=UPI00114C9A7A|nr:hypothetical protein [Oligoflexus tunisiensis]
MARKRINSSQRRKQRIPTSYGVLGVLTLAIILMLVRGNNKPESMSLSAEVPVSNARDASASMVSSQPSSVDVRQYQEELNRQRAQSAQARELGLKTLPLKPRGDTISIPLSFVPQKIWCQGGDLDTIKYATKNDRAKDLLITLEGIDRGGKNPFVRTSLQQLTQGANYTFTLPRPSEATAYGLYICSDSQKENSCQRKNLQTHASLSEQLAENPDAARAADRIFFFQNLVIDGSRVEAWRTDDFSHEFQRSISNHLLKKGLSASEVQTAWKTSSTLKSAPIAIRKDRIVLSLPYNDPRCLQKRVH